ncbi:carboxypeptidase inhibitor SmCI-like [Ornithodoros turicata]|uniref:carboxypeptidase inhibitor SmCI-like n=1 Tax=Ornithodoros turicata TaxID=34597 RepID=UPI0031393DC8
MYLEVLWLVVHFTASLRVNAIAVHGEGPCSSPPARGDCEEDHVRYYFNPYDGDCQEFVYSGCAGNENNYRNLRECMDSCLPTYKENYIPRFCYLPKGRGLCNESLLRYFYNPDSGRCEAFMYSGCMGNANNFHSVGDCKLFCRLSGQATLSRKPPMCYLPPERGSCGGFLPRFYYDEYNAECRKFQYSGCLGNDNNFATEIECEKTCG